MSYRIGERKPHGPVRTMQGTATPARWFVQNGTVLHMAVPCWYKVIEPPVPAHPHCRPWHDHVGWPSPRHPDHVCQRWDFAHSCCSFDEKKRECDHCHMYLDMSRLLPIRLRREGYTGAEVALDNPPSGLSASASIDADKDWIVRIDVSAKSEEAVKERVEIPFTVFATGTVLGREACDVVSRGTLIVLPGPFIER